MATGEHAMRQGAGGPMQQKVMKVCQAFGSLVATAATRSWRTKNLVNYGWLQLWPFTSYNYF
jgi:hypothetical protein